MDGMINDKEEIKLAFHSVSDYGVPSGPKFKVRIRYRSFRILVYFHNWSFNFLYFTLLLTIQLLCFVL